MLGRALGELPLRAGLVVDHGAADHAARAERALASAGIEPVRVEIEPSERTKSLASLETILVALARARLERGEPVVAVGGGIVGDLAGFAAASYRRGVPVLQCPTTLLAMVDASVGGKTGVNLDLGEAGGLAKNMAGAFHQPLAVIADIDTLATLPQRHLRAGLAECVKHALISADFGDGVYLDWIAA
ncbi:MAG TPA: iron-containing alcohol dehydrogenase, partial [Phycisphaerales bacterium]|nr:iron-containing alcohol dehydrogenase [Phycisphaerales bacterium]